MELRNGSDSDRHKNEGRVADSVSSFSWKFWKFHRLLQNTKSTLFNEVRERES